jgi:tetratricopeptide (TPR) repeat protein
LTLKITKIPRAIKYAFSYLKQTEVIEKLYFSSKWLDCIAECNKAITDGRDDFFTYYYLGLSNSELGLIDESTKDLTIALDSTRSGRINSGLDRCINFAKYKIALNLSRQRIYDSAIDQLNRNIDDDPEYIANYQLKASIYVDLDNLDEAIKTVQLALQKAPKHEQLIATRNELSYLYSLAQSEKRNGG